MEKKVIIKIESGVVSVETTETVPLSGLLKCIDSFTSQNLRWKIEYTLTKDGLSIFKQFGLIDPT